MEYVERGGPGLPKKKMVKSGSKPRSRKLSELKDGIRRYIRKKFSRGMKKERMIALNKKSPEGVSLIFLALFFLACGHFLFGWLILDKGWLSINKTSLPVFIIGWSLAIFLSFYFLNTLTGLKSRGLSPKKKKGLFVDYVPLSKQKLEIFMITSLLAILEGMFLCHL